MLTKPKRPWKNLEQARRHKGVFKMTQPNAVDAIMQVMQEFVDSERLKIWNLHQAWREKAERFIQFFLDDETDKSLVYVKGVFAGESVRGVRNRAHVLLKTNGHTVQFMDKSELEAKIVQLTEVVRRYAGHDHGCSIRWGPCSCGFDEALNGSEELDTWSKIQIAFPFGHRYDCGLGTMDGCDCGLHDALKKIERYNDE